MKRKIVVVLFLVFALTLSLFSFAGCKSTDNTTTENGDTTNSDNNTTNTDNNNQAPNNTTKQVPVYQGMTITNANNAIVGLSSGYSSGKLVLLSSTYSDVNNTLYDGDHTDRNDTIDKENPYPNSKGTIEEEITSSLKVTGPANTIYYATPNQDIYINIHINNPDDFEIMSFTLNGKKYSSYMFESGSDMETIVLKYNVGAVGGIVEYTIDAIKYVDGTEIKDVVIDGNQTVKAGIKTENQVAANIKDVTIGTNSLSFAATVKDNDALIELSNGALKAVLYDGFSIVAQKDISLGDNAVTFDKLKTNTLYQYAVVGYYDDLSGNGFKMNVLYKDAFYTDSIVLFDNIEVSNTSISFDFLWNENHQDKEIFAIKLYKDDVYIHSVDLSEKSIGKLLSNTTYKLVAEYRNGDNTEKINLEFTTLSSMAPQISIVNPTKTQTSVGFEISESDTDNVGSVTKIELVHPCGTIVADSLDQRVFTNLLSNNAYTVRVTYVYDFSDGEGQHTITRELSISTDAKPTPSFSIKNENITESSISAEYDVASTENIISYKIELYCGETLVAENTDKEICFTALNYYTDYKVVITYNYDLSDGKGAQTAAYDYPFKTSPYLDITGCSIANTSAVSEGDTIFMSLMLDNPLGMTVESVVINGVTYNTTGASTKNKVFVEIVYNGQFSGGDTYFKVDKVNAKIGNISLSVEPKTEISDNVFINAKLEVLKIEITNRDFEPIEWNLYSNTVYVLITLNNTAGYKLDSVTFNHGTVQEGQEVIDNLIKIDDNRWYYSRTLHECYQAIKDPIIAYSNEYTSGTISPTDYEYNSCYGLYSEGVKYIETAEDLLNMDDWAYYELKNDIDLSGIQWKGNAFYGILDGKGYSIKNMSYVGTIQNADAYLGLFSEGDGVIKNLNIENASIIAELNSTNGNTYYAYCGAFVGRGGTAAIELNNCTVDEYSTFIVKNHVGRITIGGLIGDATRVFVTLTNCTNNATINATVSYGTVGDNIFAGGFAGFISSGNIKNCVNNGSVYGKSTTPATVTAGGLFGACSLTYYYNGTVTITNCKNTGEIYACSNNNQTNVGGFIGCSSCNIIIKNSTNSGNVLSENETFGASTAAGFIAYAYANRNGTTTITLENCINTGDITIPKAHSYYIGGLIATTNTSPTINITNCINNGDLTVTGNGGVMGGLIAQSEVATLINSVNGGNITKTNGSYPSFGGLIGWKGNTITNSYSIVSGEWLNGERCTIDQLNSKEFYTVTLGFSEDVWDFSELDVENGKYPKLKQ